MLACHLFSQRKHTKELLLTLPSGSYLISLLHVCPHVHIDNKHFCGHVNVNSCFSSGGVFKDYSLAEGLLN